MSVKSFISVAAMATVTCNMTFTERAHAQGTVTFSNSVDSASVVRRIGSSTAGPTGTSIESLGNDFSFVQDRQIPTGAFTGRGFAELGATFTPSFPSGLGRVFSSVQLEACTSAEIFSSAVAPLLGTNVFETARGSARGLFQFSISSPMAWTWNGVSQGNTFNTGAYHSVTAAFGLRDIGSSFQPVNMSNTSINGVGDFFVPFSLGGVLPVGTYEITWSHESIVTGGVTSFGTFGTAQGGAPLVSCIPSVFALGPIPTPSAAALLAVGGLMAARRRRS